MASTKIRIFSWNVNGLRAVLRKGALQDFLEKQKPDVLCLQEIKCKPDQLDLFEAQALKDYNVFWNPAEKAGYSGTAVLVSKSIDEPAVEETFIGDSSDIGKKEGRILALRFAKFNLVNVYTPNSKPDLSRLKFRHDSWDPDFKNYLKELEKDLPVVTCGDYNCAHEEIDIARPKTNHHSAGFTDEEREGIKNLIDAGFTDTFRFKNPSSIRYTWWSHWGHARENNVGWRIDYFFVSDLLKKNIEEAEIYESQTGSDHCPISITLNLCEKDD